MTRQATVRAYLMALTSAALVSIAQLCLKLGMSQLPEFGAAMDWYAVDVGPLLWVALGLVCYGCSMLLWIGVLARLPLSVAYPLLSISYVMVYLVATSMPAWDEIATAQRSAGIVFIVLGVALVSWPAKPSTS
jgi:undecaprenyl phosphate-alpha-L-ara4N flippase subunit ArnF